MKKIYDISTIEALKTLAQELATELKPGSTLGLKGDLGAGKTTFVSQLVEVLGIKEAVTSPSFVLQHEYQNSGLKIEHWDLYRLNSLPEELMEPAPKGAIRIVEWFDKFHELIDMCDWQFNFRLVFSENADAILRREVLVEHMPS